MRAHPLNLNFSWSSTRDKQSQDWYQSMTGTVLQHIMTKNNEEKDLSTLSTQFIRRGQWSTSPLKMI